MPDFVCPRCGSDGPHILRTDAIGEHGLKEDDTWVSCEHCLLFEKIEKFKPYVKIFMVEVHTDTHFVDGHPPDVYRKFFQSRGDLTDFDGDDMHNHVKECLDISPDHCLTITCLGGLEDFTDIKTPKRKKR